MLDNNLRKFSLIIFVFIALLPMISLAEATGGPVNIFGVQICAQSPCRLSDVLPAIKSMISFLALRLVLPLAVLAIAFAGFKMIVYAGNSSEVSKAKDIIYNALWGVFLALAAYLIISAIIYGLTGGGSAESIINRGLGK